MSPSMISEPEQGVAGRALLQSKDPIIGQQLAVSMRRFAIAAKLCPDTKQAQLLLNTHKFDAAVVDLAGSDSAASLLQSVRASPSSQSAVTFAIVDAKTRHVSKDVKAQFVIERDSSNTLLSNMQKVALGLIIREHRRYFRCSVDIAASITLDDGSKAPGTIKNLKRRRRSYAGKHELQARKSATDRLSSNRGVQHRLRNLLVR